MILFIVLDALVRGLVLYDKEERKKIHVSWGRCLRAGFRTPLRDRRVD
jgi:hypothetical protein